jgi:hypothetical protein
VRSRIRPFPTRASEVTQCGSVGDNVGDSPEPHFRPRLYAVGALPRTEIDTGCKSNRNLLNVVAVSLETSKIGTADAQRGSSPRFFQRRLQDRDGPLAGLNGMRRVGIPRRQGVADTPGRQRRPRDRCRRADRRGARGQCRARAADLANGRRQCLWQSTRARRVDRRREPPGRSRHRVPRSSPRDR